MEYIHDYVKKVSVRIHTNTPVNLTYNLQGDTLFVTTGAGPVGSCVPSPPVHYSHSLLTPHPLTHSLVIQLAKRQGLKVIASAGSDEKVKFMQACGADVAFNYKTTSIKDVLAEHGPINV